MKKDRLISQCTVQEFTDALIAGNGYGQDMLYIKEYFGDSKYNTIEEYVSPYEHNLAQASMINFFEKNLGYAKTDELFIDETGECTVTYENIEVNSGKFLRGYKNAYVGYSKGDKKILVKINRYNPRETVTYNLYSEDADILLKQWFAYAKEHNFYRGQKIDGNCGFVNVSDASWNDLILPEKIVNVIKHQSSELFDNREVLAANGIMLKRGIILSSGPGNGKTLCCRILAKEAQCTVIFALPSHLSSAEEVRRVCKMTKDLAPCLLILEDIDWIAESRTDSPDAGRVIELMNHLDGIEDFSNVVTIATTNSVDNIEKAIKNRPGRFDRIITVNRPDAECRYKMLKVFTSKWIVAEDVDFDEIVTQTETNTDENKDGGYSGAHMKDLCITAALFAIREGSIDKNKKAIIKRSHFKHAIKEINNKDFSSFFKRKGMGFTTEVDDD